MLSPLLLISLVFALSSYGASGAAIVSASSSFKFKISEGLPNGTYVGTLATSNNGQNDGQYLVIDSSGQRTLLQDFNINQATGEIRTATVLDRERTSHYSFTAINDRKGNEMEFSIIVIDVNDNRPQFNPNRISINIAENQSAPSPSSSSRFLRTLPIAIDSDSAPFGVVDYRIVSGNHHEIFKLNKRYEPTLSSSTTVVNNGHVTMSGIDVSSTQNQQLYVDIELANGHLLDRENQSSYQLTIEAIDGGQPALIGQLLIDVQILDVNDNKPIFTRDEYETEVKESVPVNTPILKVQAHDADIDSNGQVTYHIVKRVGQTTPTTTTYAPSNLSTDRSAQQANDAPYFSINSTTGEIYLSRELDFETEPLHQIVVEARDGGSPALKSYSLVYIKVINVNDNIPNVDLSFLSLARGPYVDEKCKIGTTVARITIDDADYPNSASANAAASLREPRITPNTINVLDPTSPSTGPQSCMKFNLMFQVTLSGGDNKFELMCQDAFTYLLIVVAQLDRFNKSVYHLKLTVRDNFDTIQTPNRNTTPNRSVTIVRTIDLHITDQATLAAMATDSPYNHINNSLSDRQTAFGGLGYSLWGDNSMLSQLALLTITVAPPKLIFVVVFGVFVTVAMGLILMAKRRSAISTQSTSSVYNECALAMSANNSTTNSRQQQCHQSINGSVREHSINTLTPLNGYRSISSEMDMDGYQGMDDYRDEMLANLDRWTNIGDVPCQLLPDQALAGSYNWDYLADRSPCYPKMVNILSDAMALKSGINSLGSHYGKNGDSDRDSLPSCYSS